MSVLIRYFPKKKKVSILVGPNKVSVWRGLTVLDFSFLYPQKSLSATMGLDSSYLYILPCFFFQKFNLFITICEKILLFLFNII